MGQNIGVKSKFRILMKWNESAVFRYEKALELGFNFNKFDFRNEMGIKVLHLSF